jgi:hypothetical protein
VQAGIVPNQFAVVKQLARGDFLFGNQGFVIHLQHASRHNSTPMRHHAIELDIEAASIEQVEAVTMEGGVLLKRFAEVA